MRELSLDCSARALLREHEGIPLGSRARRPPARSSRLKLTIALPLLPRYMHWHGATGGGTCRRDRIAPRRVGDGGLLVHGTGGGAVGEPRRVFGLGGRFPPAVSHGMRLLHALVCRGVRMLPSLRMCRLRIYSGCRYIVLKARFSHFLFLTRLEENATPWCGAHA